MWINWNFLFPTINSCNSILVLRNHIYVREMPFCIEYINSGALFENKHVLFLRCPCSNITMTIVWNFRQLDFIEFWIRYSSWNDISFKSLVEQKTIINTSLVNRKNIDWKNGYRNFKREKLWFLNKIFYKCINDEAHFPVHLIKTNDLAGNAIIQYKKRFNRSNNFIKIFYRI